MGKESLNRRHLGSTQDQDERYERQRRIESLEKMQSPAGGWNRATLRRLGIEWPPPRAWKAKLLADFDFWQIINKARKA